MVYLINNYYRFGYVEECQPIDFSYLDVVNPGSYQTPQGGFFGE
jgi:hypothetical protein